MSQQIERWAPASTGQRELAQPERIAHPEHSVRRWLARFSGATLSGRMRAMLVALQEAVTRAAAGAARTSMRLSSMSKQIKRSSAALDEMLGATGNLNEAIKRIADSS